PSTTLGSLDVRDDELRRIAARALNKYVAEAYMPFSDRIAPVASIPMHTPEEAIDELEYAVNKLGFKAITMMGGVTRSLPLAEREFPKYAHLATYRDTLCIDSPYDYDPVWRKCRELKVVVACHGQADVGAATYTNFMYNHLRHFAVGSEAF